VAEQAMVSWRVNVWVGLPVGMARVVTILTIVGSELLLCRGSVLGVLLGST
jgi:hypothetical protein